MLFSILKEKKLDIATRHFSKKAEYLGHFHIKDTEVGIQ